MARRTILSFGGAGLPASPTITGTLTVGGQILVADGTVGAPSIAFASAPTWGIYKNSNYGIMFGLAASPSAAIGGPGLYLPNDAPLAWNSGALTGAASLDVILRRDVAGVLALRNGVNAQLFNVYNTTDVGLANYEKLNLGWAGNTCFITTSQAGSGASRTIQLGTEGSGTVVLRTNGTARWAVDASGHLTSVANYNIWNGVAALTTTATSGFVGIPSCAGPPTGVPASVPTGQIALCYDSTNDQLYIYRAGWKKIPAVSYS